MRGAAGPDSESLGSRTGSVTGPFGESLSSTSSKSMQNQETTDPCDSFDHYYTQPAANVEEFLTPLPRIKQLVGVSVRKSGKNLSFEELGYLRSAGKEMPTEAGGELYAA